MTEKDSEKSIRGVPLLSTKTFPDWKWHLRGLLRSWECWEVTKDPPTPAPAPLDPENISITEAAAILAYKSKINRAVGAIHLTATRSHRALLEPHEDNPAGMWKAICQMYENKDVAMRFNAATRLQAARKQESESWGDFVTRVEDLGYTLDSLRPDNWSVEQEAQETIAWVILSSIPESHKALRTSLVQKDSISLSAIRTAFIRDNIDDDKPQEEAHLASSPAPPQDKSKDKCFFCHKPGHWESECLTKRKLSDEMAAGGSGHGRSNSQNGNRQNNRSKRGRGGRGGFSYANHTQDYTNHPFYPPVSYQYPYGGYFPPPHYSGGYLPQPSQQPSPASAPSSMHEYAGNASQSISLHSPIADFIWIMDSGSTSNMTWNRSWIHNLVPIHRPVKLADGSVIYAEGIGWVIFKPHVEGRIANDFILERVLYVPRLKSNLLSTQCLTQNGRHTVLFTDKRVEIRRGNEIVLVGHLSTGNTFHMAGETKQIEMAFAASTHAAPLSTWHRRFNHLHYDSLRNLMHSAAVSNFNVKGGSNENQICEPCILGKQRKAPHTKPAERANRILGRIFSDLHGPISTESREGARYWITFIDDKSRYVAVYFLRRKSEAFEAFQKFKMYVENQLDSKIQRLRDDKGGEFISNEFHDFCTQHGIHREHTIRDTPQQNGVAERYNRTLAEGVTAMLAHSKLPPSMWAYAARAFTFIHNRSPSSTLAAGFTPFELWFKRKPSAIGIWTWGCLAWVFVHKSQRKSLQPKAKRCIFVGYAENFKGWTFLDLETGSEITSDSATFDEGIFPGKIRTKSPPIIPTIDLSAFLPSLPPTIISYPIVTAPVVPVPPPNTPPAIPPPVPPAIRTPLPQNPAPLAVPRAATRELRALTSHFETMPQNLPPRRAARGRQPGTLLEPDTDDETAALAKDLDHQVEFVEIAVENGVEFALSTTANIPPNTLEEASKLPDRDKWLAAALDEIRAHLDNGTWKLVRLPHGKRVIGCRWVFRIKKNADGSIDKYKGRIVAKGYAQRHGIEYTETFAPTAHFGAIRSVIALAEIEDMELESVDISTAFLNSNIDAEIYMKKPEGYNPEGSEGPEWVLQLLKGLYGIKQGPHIWSVKLHNELKKIGFHRIETDHSVFIYERDAVKIIVPVHVDDLLLASKSAAGIAKVKVELKKVFKIHDQGPTKQILGIKLERNRKSRTIWLSQPAYIEDILRLYKMERCNPAITPMMENVRLSSKMCPQTEKEFAEIDQAQYREAVGKLLYLAIATRPDIAYVVGVLCRFNANPGKEHWDAVHHLLRYLRGTTNLRLMYSPTLSPHLFTAHTDSDLGGNIDNSRSTAGHAISIGTGAVMWGSKLQKHVCLSSTEAEYTTASAAGCEIMWMRYFLEELGYDTSRPSPLFLDSGSAETVAKNPEHQSTMKHVHRAYHWIREHVAEKNMALYHVPGAENPADIFTKPLGRTKFIRFRDALGLRE